MDLHESAKKLRDGASSRKEAELADIAVAIGRGAEEGTVARPLATDLLMDITRLLGTLERDRA